VLTTENWLVKQNNSCYNSVKGVSKFTCIENLTLGWSSYDKLDNVSLKCLEH